MRKLWQQPQCLTHERMLCHRSHQRIGQADVRCVWQQQPLSLDERVDALDWPDKGFPQRHCLRGSKVTGEAPDTGLWRKKDAERLAAEMVSCCAKSVVKTGEKKQKKKSSKKSY